MNRQHKQRADKRTHNSTQHCQIFRQSFQQTETNKVIRCVVSDVDQPEFNNLVGTIDLMTPAKNQQVALRIKTEFAEV